MAPELTPELIKMFGLFRKCLDLRDKYMTVSSQRLSDNPRDHDGIFHGIPEGMSDVMGVRPEAASKYVPPEEQFDPWHIYPRPRPPHWHWTGDKELVPSGTAHPCDVFDISRVDIPGAHEWEFEIDDKGIYQLYHDVSGKPVLSNIVFLLSRLLAKDKQPIFDIPSIREYFIDLDFVLGVISDGPTKSFAFRRLQYLRSKFTMYSLLNEFQEMTEMKVCALSDIILTLY